MKWIKFEMDSNTGIISDKCLAKFKDVRFPVMIFRGLYGYEFLQNFPESKDEAMYELACIEYFADFERVRKKDMQDCPYDSEEELMKANAEKIVKYCRSLGYDNDKIKSLFSIKGNE